MISRIGEIIEASTAEFTAQSYELHQPPPFGSLVKTREGDVDIYAVVSGAETTSMDPGRRPIARGAEEADDADIYLSSPQLAKLLRTEFNAAVVGYREGGRLHHYMPPRPARIHSFVYLCQPEEVALFSQSLDFLNILVNQQLPADELIAASLRNAASAHADRHQFLVGAGRELAVLLGGRASRLSAILRRMEG